MRTKISRPKETFIRNLLSEIFLFILNRTCPFCNPDIYYNIFRKIETDPVIETLPLGYYSCTLHECSLCKIWVPYEKAHAWSGNTISRLGLRIARGINASAIEEKLPRYFTEFKTCFFSCDGLSLTSANKLSIFVPFKLLMVICWKSYGP